jgi:hypothetical protein
MHWLARREASGASYIGIDFTLHLSIITSSRPSFPIPTRPFCPCWRGKMAESGASLVDTTQTTPTVSVSLFTSLPFKDNKGLWLHLV